MSTPNPYAAPTSRNYRKSNNRRYAQEKIRPPALNLMIFTIIAMVVIVLGIVLNVLDLMGFLGLPDPNTAEMDGIVTIVGLITGVLGLITGGVIIYGCRQAMQLKNYNLVMASFIISMIPFISPCCCSGIPIGIWGLVILKDHEVSSSFR